MSRRRGGPGTGGLTFRQGLVAGGASMLVLVLLVLGLTGNRSGSEPAVPAGAVRTAGPAAPATAAPQPSDPAAAAGTSPAGQQDDEDGDEEEQVDQQDAAGGSGVGSAAPVSGAPRADRLPSSDRVSCPVATRTVATAAELTAALAAAAPGDVIELADGTYSGAFTATTSGNAGAPIWLCGGREAVLDAGGPKEGYGFHLAGAQHWRLVGFTVRNAQKGVVADGTSGSVLQDLLVEDIGDEAIHLRSGSTGNAVLDCTVSRTGLRKEKFGEGVYVGSAESNWDQYGEGGGPDRSDYNLVARNDISGTTSESVDIKEGTTGGALVGNTFDGTGMSAADSWVDVKGNDWLIRGNTGRNTPGDGIQTHRILDGWGTGNVFDANVLDVAAPGVAISIHKPKVTDNRIPCTNRDSSGRPVTTSPACSG
ncbi:right-handed parallel beta-helix repeat-containing protein [Kineococcus arenarius]|uniref:hypothetical protein n=1 Tax=Kineococcus sp. SYSU DK007 TaxID=3383128 RepID=UPI003D7D11BD